MTSATRILMPVLLALLLAGPAMADDSVLDESWIEIRTAHFHTYSSGTTQNVARLAARLEQFYQTYSLLAGTQAVVSPPVVVMAFPDHRSMRPFLPRYQGQPANLAGFFKRGPDENLIVLPLEGTSAGSLEIVFHEYTHLLMRRNERFWPIWLKEGMADIYATFEVTGDRTARIGRPMPLYLSLLGNEKMMPLRHLMRVSRDSPDYNERDRQGIFYAQSWLLTHYLMVGNPNRRAQFGRYTALLKAGESAEEAMVKTFNTSIAVLESELQAYLKRRPSQSLPVAVAGGLSAPKAMRIRSLPKEEVCFRLGDLLFRIGRTSEAKDWFDRGIDANPNSPLPYEGLGLLAAETGRPTVAMAHLERAMQRGSRSFLVHFVYAREKLRLAAKAPDTYTRMPDEVAAPILAHLETANALMPNSGPVQHLLGFLQLLQGEDLSKAEQHLVRAVQLEPENPTYSLSLAQAQIALDRPEDAKATLEGLQRPYIDASLRDHASELMSRLR